MSFSKLTKAQLVELLEETERTLGNAVIEAEEESNKYREHHGVDVASKYAFQTGYLGGRIRSVNFILDTYKNLHK
jgi:hypothetical protein